MKKYRVLMAALCAAFLLCGIRLYKLLKQTA